MNDKSGAPDGAAVPDVTQIPLLGLVSHDDHVLDTAIRRLIEDVTDGREITAQFGNSP